MDFNAHRGEIYAWLRRCLIGPGAAGGSDLHRIKPLDRYQTGILFLIVRGEDGLDPASDIEIAVTITVTALLNTYNMSFSLHGTIISDRYSRPPPPCHPTWKQAQSSLL